eukprot:9856161-Lingulodinium_polyedra.AAC.1
MASAAGSRPALPRRGPWRRLCAGLPRHGARASRLRRSWASSSRWPCSAVAPWGSPVPSTPSSTGASSGPARSGPPRPTSSRPWRPCFPWSGPI